MPDALEYVVRPYQSPNAHGAIIIPSTPGGGQQKASRTWGAAATMPQVQGMNFEVVCCKDTLTEKNRETETVRIYQNGDENSSNYIDYERPLKMNLDKKDSNNCGDNWDDISGVAQAIEADLAEWSSLINSGAGTQPGNCASSWEFKPTLGT